LIFVCEAPNLVLIFIHPLIQLFLYVSLKWNELLAISQSLWFFLQLSAFACIIPFCRKISTFLCDQSYLHFTSLDAISYTWSRDLPSGEWIQRGSELKDTRCSRGWGSGWYWTDLNWMSWDERLSKSLHHSKKKYWCLVPFSISNTNSDNQLYNLQKKIGRFFFNKKITCHTDGDTWRFTYKTVGSFPKLINWWMKTLINKPIPIPRASNRHVCMHMHLPLPFNMNRLPNIIRLWRKPPT
jgi:hypothetical protein